MATPSSNEESGLFELARASMSPDRAMEALPAVEAGLRSNPLSPRLWHVKGLLQRELDHHREALVALERGQELAPSQPKIAWAVAQTRFEAGLPAVDAYARALELNPGIPDVIMGLSDALLAAGRSTEAIEGLDNLLTRSPEWVDGHEQLARIRWMEGEREGFARSFDRAILACPTHQDLRRAQFAVLLHANHFDAIFAAIEDARAALGEVPLVVVNEAIALAESGDWATAEKMFAPFGGFDDIAVQVRRMRLLLRTGRPAEAAAIRQQFKDHAEAFHMIPYLAVAMRMLDDPQWQWLEGQEALVGVYDLADRLPPLPALAERLRMVHRARGQQLDQSVRGGTQTHGNLLMHVDPLIAATAVVIRDTVAQYIAKLPPVDARHPTLSAPRGRPVRFAGSWSVRLTSGGYHSNHVHPMGWISSAMYVVLPPQLGPNDKSGQLMLGEPQAELGLNLAAFRSIEPKLGRLVLFPSTMWHGTVPFAARAGESERLTIAFDVARPH